MNLVIMRTVFILLFVTLLVVSLFHNTLSANEQGGEIEGVIKLSGQAPLNKSYLVSINQDVCGNNVESDDFILNSANLGVKNVFVSLKKSETENSNSEPILEPVTLDNFKCHIVPSVLGINVGQPINIRNSDPIFHSLQFMDNDRFLFNVALPKGGAIVRKKLDHPGIIQVKCAVHPFMRGSIYVSDTPLYTFTDHDGKYRLTGLKPGRYFLKVRHKALKSVEKEIEIGPGKMINFSVDLEKAEE